MDKIQSGLTSDEVKQRISQGKTNQSSVRTTKTFGQILKENTFTLFNLINAILGGLVFITGSHKNMLFFILAISNTAIGTFQEYRAKRVLDKLILMTAPVATVIRNGETLDIPVEQVVLDDILLLTPGRQIPADGVVVHSENCDINESLLTGESDSVPKLDGDKVLSGSFVQSGRAYVQVTAVGDDSYVNQLAAKSRQYKKAPSELRDAQNWILKTVSIVIIPLGIALFLTQVFASGQTWQMGILTATAGVLGVLPEGLILLTSISMAVGSMKLATKRTLIQQAQAIETLARVDILCLDKTGTLTTGILAVEEIQVLGENSLEEVSQILATLMPVFPDLNATSAAIAHHVEGQTKKDWTCENSVPFSSVYKWSGADFGTHGTYLLGAPEVVGGATATQDDGRRVLSLCVSRQRLENREIPTDSVPLAHVFISDTLRETAPATMQYFAEQDVKIRIISGDNPQTVSTIAKQAGVSGAERYISCDALPESNEALKALVEETVVFGRVSPASKKRLVSALQSNGHIVAMTGDGVNDVLALKQADCSIAMASGSDATRGVAQIVLLDSDFSTLPSAVLEGRRIINNIERVSSMYLVKTFYSFLLAFVFVFYTQPYPFMPIHHTLIGALTVGVPSFFLALEPNGNRVKKGYLFRAMRLSLPTALTVAILVLASYIIVPNVMDNGNLTLICPVITCIIGLMTVFRLCRPFNLVRTALLAAMTLGAVLGFGFLGYLFILPPFTQESLLYVGILALVAYPMVSGLMLITEKLLRKYFHPHMGGVGKQQGLG